MGHPTQRDTIACSQSERHVVMRREYPLCPRGREEANAFILSSSFG